MYDFCTYHNIDNFIPPTLEAENELQNSLLRLESLSACAIVKDTKNNCKILSQIPRPLHTVIWKAYLRDEYYNKCDCQSEPVLPHLSELVYHWPDKKFNITKIMPSFPAKRSWFIPSWHYSEISPLFHIKHNLQQFYDSVTLTILKSLTNIKSCDIREIDFTHNASAADNNDNNIIELNIRGFSTIGIKQIFHLIKPRENPFDNDVGDIEIILDAKLDIEEEEMGRGNEEVDSVTEGSDDYNRFDNDEEFDNFDLDVEGTEDFEDDFPMAITSYYANLSNSIVKYGHLSLYGNLTCLSLTGGLLAMAQQVLAYTMPQFHRTKYAIQVIEKSLKKGTESLRIGMNIDISKLIKEVFETTINQINLRSLELKVEVDSITFLTNFDILEHLTLYRSNLNGKLKPLLNMKKGLHFLELNECNLDNSDLDVLLRSCHKSSLLELSLCGNRFGKNSTNLIKLCQELPNVIKLDLGFCELQDLHDNDLRLLCDSIKSLPNLVNLNLNRNYFSMDTITSHLTSLSASPSLRLIRLVMSTSKLRGSWKKKDKTVGLFSRLINTTMNKERSQLLYVEIMRQSFEGEPASICCICKSEIY